MTRPSSSLAFSADLAFVFCVPWLLLWRLELPSVIRPGALWGGFWPLIVVLGLVTLAFIIGLFQRTPRGFLPYALRWLSLAAVLVLPLWTVFSLVDARRQAATLRGPALIAREDSKQTMAAATTEAERKQAQTALVAAEDALTLTDAVNVAEERGVKVPKVNLEGLPEARGLALETLDPGTREMLEFGFGLAEALDDEGLGEEFGEFEEIVGDLGLDNPKIRMALIALVAPLLAPALGLSTPAVIALLEGLFEAGKLTFGGTLRVGTALASSALPDGGFDEAKLMESFQRYGEMADAAVTIIDEAERVGGETVRSSDAVKLLKKTAREASGKRQSIDSMCPPEKQRAARVFADGDREKLRRQLEKTCPDLSGEALDNLAVAG